MIILILLFSLFLVPKIYAIDPVVKITNFSSNSSPEWVEINNTTGDTINIDNWLLKDANNISTDDLIISGCLSPFSYQTFYHDPGWLNDGGDTINLFDDLNNLIDQLIYTKGKIDLSPRSTNSCTPTILLTPTPFVSPEPTAKANLIITEIMASPDTGQDEWIEIYNPSSESISLKDFCFYDRLENSRCFYDDAIISPLSYFSHSFSSGFLNNDGDTVTFLDTSITYSKSNKNLSYSRQPDDSWCFTDPSQNQENNLCSSTEAIATSKFEEIYISPLLNLEFVPDSVTAGEDFNLVFSLKSSELFSLRLIFPFTSQYFPFSNFKDGYSWLTLPLSVSKKLPPGQYPLSFHLKKANSSHLYDYQIGIINIKAPIITPKVTKPKVLGASTYSCPQCPDNSASVNYYPASTLREVKPDTNIFSWPFMFAGSILFLLPLLFPKLYSA
ncbi:MAG TPA: lamin tail domain-containing protein [Candidatus Woesebacteria bacterium]|nr:lamin tail domain-containing protein [Candidatus Woesebacteria bacterium]